MLSGIELAEQGWLPDPLIRFGIRRLLSARIREELRLGCEGLSNLEREFVAEIRQSPVALHTDSANEQHYEVPAAYFELVLGPHRKYSSCLWPARTTKLGEAEEAMLDLTCKRARLTDGMEILELGCGWGSLSLFMAKRFPNSRILAVSNSASQREFITAQAVAAGISNLSAQTCNMVDFTTSRCFDRVISIEMFEHMRNYEQLFARIANWLKPAGKLFAHVFYHGRCTYPFEADGNNDWMARHFFTGGLMPSADLFLQFQRDLVFEDRWRINGEHYQKTLEAWLVRHDAAEEQIRPIFESAYGRELAPIMFRRWRMFYLACAELFGYAHGEEWGVAHFLFANRQGSPR
jgi:cyclopropane-fatty-acyl-phospholipid synthase